MKRSKGGSDVWRTPEFLIRQVAAKCGGFDVDLCADEDNAVCRAYSNDIETLAKAVAHGPTLRRWTRGWCNPPYSKMKMVSRAILGILGAGAIGEVWILFPASRTEQKWFGDLLTKAHKIIYITPRVPFDDGTGCVAGNNHPSMILVLRPGNRPPEIRVEIMDLSDAIKALRKGASDE